MKVKLMSSDQLPRAMMFVDGFNLYHPLKEIAENQNLNHIKWLNLRALADRIAKRRNEQILGVTYCTAYQERDHDAKQRHKLYNDALRHVGVEIIMGHYVTVPTLLCNECGMEGEKPTEKQTDINVALSLFRAAYHDLYDVAYLVSVDSDQAATASHFASEFPEKTLVSVSPPGKSHSSKLLAKNGGAKVTLSLDDIKACRFPNTIMRTSTGKAPITCPREYHLNA